MDTYLIFSHLILGSIGLISHLQPSGQTHCNRHKSRRPSICRNMHCFFHQFGINVVDYTVHFSVSLALNLQLQIYTQCVETKHVVVYFEWYNCYTCTFSVALTSCLPKELILRFQVTYSEQSKPWLSQEHHAERWCYIISRVNNPGEAVW